MAPASRTPTESDRLITGAAQRSTASDRQARSRRGQLCIAKRLGGLQTGDRRWIVCRETGGPADDVLVDYDTEGEANADLVARQAEEAS